MTLLIEQIAAANYSTLPLTLTPITTPAILGSPIIGYQGMSIAPTAMTSNYLENKLTVAGAAVNLVPIAATYPLAATGSVSIAVDPNATAATSAAVIEYGIGIGNPNGTGSGAMLTVYYGGAPGSKGLSVSMNGTATVIDANYTSAMAFVVVLNLATGGLEIITPNGTFTPTAVAPMGATTTINLLAMLENASAVTSTLTLVYETVTGGNSAYGLTVPAGVTQLMGQTPPSLPSGYALGDRYQVISGGVLLAPNGVKMNIPTNAIIEVIGTTAQPEVNVTSFYQQSDIASIASAANTPSTLDGMGLDPSVLTAGVFQSDISPIEIPASVISSSLNSYTPIGSTVALVGTTPVQHSVSAVENLVKANSVKFGSAGDPFGPNGLFWSYQHNSGLWDSSLLPAIPTNGYINSSGTVNGGFNGAKGLFNGGVFEFRYRTPAPSGTTECIIGVFSPLNNTGGERSYVNISNYNAAPVGAHTLFAYLDLVAGNFVINQNPSAATSGSTSTVTAISGLTLASLNEGDVFTFVVGGTPTVAPNVQVYKNGISIVASTPLSFTSDKDVYLAPFGITAPTSNPELFLLNSGQLPFKYFAHGLYPVPLFDGRNSSPTSGTLTSTAPSYTIDTKLDPITNITLSNATGTVALFMPAANVNDTTDVLNYLDEIKVVVTGALPTGTNASVLTLNGNITDVYYNGTVGYYVFKKAVTVTSLQTSTNFAPYVLVSKHLVHPDPVVVPAVWNSAGPMYNVTVSEGVDFYEVDLTNGSGTLGVAPLVAGVFPSKMVLKVMPSSSAFYSLTVPSSGFQNAYNVPPTPYYSASVLAQYLEFEYDPTAAVYRFVRATPEPVAIIVPNIYPSGATPGTISNGVATLAKASVESVQFTVPITSAMRVGSTMALALQFAATTTSGNVDLQVSYQVSWPGGTPPAATVATETIAVPTTSGSFANHVTTTALISIPLGAVGYMLTVVLTRLSTNASDTCTGDMQLYNVTLVQ